MKIEPLSKDDISSIFYEQTEFALFIKYGTPTRSHTEWISLQINDISTGGLLISNTPPLFTFTRSRVACRNFQLNIVDLFWTVREAFYLQENAPTKP